MIHTFAPWHVSGDLSTCVDVYAGTIRVAMIDDEVEIPDHELMANARLIAAAPELLAALRWYVDQLRDDAVIDMAKLTNEMERKAITAITKATGDNA